jgi:hypothetical protein
MSPYKLSQQRLAKRRISTTGRWEQQCICSDITLTAPAGTQEIYCRSHAAAAQPVCYRASHCKPCSGVGAHGASSGPLVRAGNMAPWEILVYGKGGSGAPQPASAGKRYPAPSMTKDHHFYGPSLVCYCTPCSMLRGAPTAARGALCAPLLTSSRKQARAALHSNRFRQTHSPRHSRRALKRYGAHTAFCPAALKTHSMPQAHPRCPPKKECQKISRPERMLIGGEHSCPG